jgi:hypothetical protein
LNFLNAYVKKDEAALALLNNGADSRDLVKKEVKQPALKPVPTEEEFESLLGAGLNQSGATLESTSQAAQIFREAKKENPEVVCSKKARSISLPSAACVKIKRRKRWRFIN